MNITRIITRKEAMAFVARRGHTRGPGPAVDFINYGLINDKGKLVAAARIAPAPYGNSPAKAAVGQFLADRCVYLSRQIGAGITHADLVEFIQNYTLRLHSDLAERGRDIRYLLSMDDPQEKLIDSPLWGVLTNQRAVTGKTYIEAGALHAGVTQASKSARYINKAGLVRSTYQAGHNITAQVEELGLPLIAEGAKHRFIFVLAPSGSLSYRAWRNALPLWVREAGDLFGYVQPRMLVQASYQKRNDLQHDYAGN